MKKTITGVFLLLIGSTPLSAQWTTTGNHISNSNSGNVGIGTTAPAQKLDVRGHMVFEVGGNPAIYTGIASSELNRYLLVMNSTGHESASGLKAGGILVADVYNYASPSKNDLIVKGRVGIGTANPDYSLTVNGGVHAREVRVDLSIPGPDYVFEKEYQLLSIEELQTYIDKHGHLPDVPSANEMKRDGVELATMNLVLLKKVEELTLYVIEQDKISRELKERIKALENR